jgi:hypothetical protein
VLALRVGHILALPLSAPTSLSKTRRVPRARAAADASRSSAPTRSARHEPAQLHDAGVACMTCRSLPPVPSQLHPPQHVFMIMHCVTAGNVRRPGAHPDPDLRLVLNMQSDPDQHPIPSVRWVSTFCAWNMPQSCWRHVTAAGPVPSALVEMSHDTLRLLRVCRNLTNESPDTVAIKYRQVRACTAHQRADVTTCPASCQAYQLHSRWPASRRATL